MSMAYNETAFVGDATDLTEPNENTRLKVPNENNGSYQNLPVTTKIGLTTECIAGLHDNKEFFPSGGLKLIGINEGIQENSNGGLPIAEEFPDTTYDVREKSTDITSDTIIRYCWIVMFYWLLPLGDLISDAIITGIVSNPENCFNENTAKLIFESD